MSNIKKPTWLRAMYTGDSRPRRVKIKLDEWGDTPIFDENGKITIEFEAGSLGDFRKQVDLRDISYWEARPQSDLLATPTDPEVKLPVWWVRNGGKFILTQNCGTLVTFQDTCLQRSLDNISEVEITPPPSRWPVPTFSWSLDWEVHADSPMTEMESPAPIPSRPVITRDILHNFVASQRQAVFRPFKAGTKERLKDSNPAFYVAEYYINDSQIKKIQFTFSKGSTKVRITDEDHCDVIETSDICFFDELDLDKISIDDAAKIVFEGMLFTSGRLQDLRRMPDLKPLAWQGHDVLPILLYKNQSKSYVVEYKTQRILNSDLHHFASEVLDYLTDIDIPEPSSEVVFDHAVLPTRKFGTIYIGNDCTYEKVLLGLEPEEYADPVSHYRVIFMGRSWKVPCYPGRVRPPVIWAAFLDFIEDKWKKEGILPTSDAHDESFDRNERERIDRWPDEYQAEADKNGTRNTGMEEAQMQELNALYEVANKVVGTVEDFKRKGSKSDMRNAIRREWASLEDTYTAYHEIEKVLEEKSVRRLAIHSTKKVTNTVATSAKTVAADQFLETALEILVKKGLREDNPIVPLLENPTYREIAKALLSIVLIYASESNMLPKPQAIRAVSELQLSASATKAMTQIITPLRQDFLSLGEKAQTVMDHVSPSQVPLGETGKQMKEEKEEVAPVLAT